MNKEIKDWFQIASLIYDAWYLGAGKDEPNQELYGPIFFFTFIPLLSASVSEAFDRLTGAR